VGHVLLVEEHAHDVQVQPLQGRDRGLHLHDVVLDVAQQRVRKLVYVFLRFYLVAFQQLFQSLLVY